MNQRSVRRELRTRIHGTISFYTVRIAPMPRLLFLTSCSNSHRCVRAESWPSQWNSVYWSNVDHQQRIFAGEIMYEWYYRMELAAYQWLEFIVPITFLQHNITEVRDGHASMDSPFLWDVKNPVPRNPIFRWENVRPYETGWGSSASKSVRRFASRQSGQRESHGTVLTVWIWCWCESVLQSIASSLSLAVFNFTWTKVLYAGFPVTLRVRNTDWNPLTKIVESYRI